MSITIPDSHKTYLKEAYLKIYDDYLNRKKSLENEWIELEKVLHELDIPTLANSSSFVTRVNEIVLPNPRYRMHYSTLSGWLKKAEFIINVQQRPLTTNEIIDIMDNGYETVGRAALMNSVPATLSVAAREGKINRSQRNGDGEFEYYPDSIKKAD